MDKEDEPRFEGRSEPRFEGRSEPRFEGRSEPRFEGGSEPRFEGRSEPRFEGRSEPRFEGRSEPRSEGKERDMDNQEMERITTGMVTRNEEKTLRPSRNRKRRNIITDSDSSSPGGASRERTRKYRRRSRARRGGSRRTEQGSDSSDNWQSCIKGGTTGVCTNLNRCQTSIDDLKRRINPQICSFDNTDPIVCCLDGRVSGSPAVATTTRRPSVSSTTEYIPPVYDYEIVGQTNGQCEPIEPHMTVKKTGQKALDKCIEYQEKYVLPCEKGVALTGEFSRSNRCHHNADELIIGGTDAALYEFPHMVMVGYGDKIEDVQYLCGGALISDRYVLTAGHCISSRDIGPITYVLVGALRRSESSDRSKTYKVKTIIKHPEYRPPSKYNDIALVETEKPIALSEFVVPVCLPAGDPISEDKVQATGWGLTQYSGSVSETLQKVVLHKFSTTECMQKYTPVRLMKQGFDAQSQTCYGDRQVSKDTCQGDSGGPIQIKNKNISCMYTVVGVTSFGRACGFVGEPGIYTRVLNYVPWIESIVWP